jgi:predicted AAA+ superfamily ATPase
MYLHRLLEKAIDHILKRKKSILLLGARQTGKTTLIDRLPAAKYFTLANLKNRLRYEKDPTALASEIEQLAAQNKTKNLPLIIIDEIQKVPILMDAIQDLIDRKVARFILTGSSARKLRSKGTVNLLPGRLMPLHLDPLTYREIATHTPYSLNDFLLDGGLPEIVLEKNTAERETLLEAYVITYLEEEIRAEALVRELGNFARFLELAASESGRIVNFSKLSQEIGVAHSTIMSYYQILEDCLVVERIEPICESGTRKKLSKSQKYLFYDLGVRRIAAREGRRLSREHMGHLFEHYVGLELIRYMRSEQQRSSLHYWRDPNGIEVDWVIKTEKKYFPIEVKWTERPSGADIKNLQIFLNEYPQAEKAFVICQTPHPMKLSENIVALPWQQLFDVVSILT